jgi:hypothetical protein
VEKGLLQLMQQLGAMASQAQQAVAEATGQEKAREEDEDEDEPDQRAERARDAEGVDAGIVAHIEEQFLKATHDREEALRLKELLDRHDLFKRYEDRFLNLFRRESETPPA